MNLFPNGIKGLSDSKWSGVIGSAYRLVGIDIHSTPGLIKVHQKLTKNSGATVDELCKQRIAVSDGSTLWFSSESGKIWRESAGVWTLKHTTVPTDGGAACLGAHEFEHWVYWATESYIHRIHVDDIGGDWASYVYDNYLAFANGDDTYHPMLEQNLDLFIGDKTNISKIAAPTTADGSPSGTLSTALGSSVKWDSFGFLVNPSELAFPAVRASERATYPVVANTFDFNSLVVGGGGGGAVQQGGVSGNHGGGGGGGGFVETAHTGVAEGSYTVTIGAGGANGTGSANGGNGGSSSLGNLVTALGGGGGGTGGGGASGSNGASGGGGGGAHSGGTGTVGQGNNGGAGTSDTNGGGGGGGGAGTAGSNGSSFFGGGGGNGLSSSISGSSVTYAGGGGGGGSPSGSAGLGGGSSANTGGGGNAGGTSAGVGGSGIVIISYPTGSMTATGGTITTSGGNTIHTFTSDGTFAIMRTTLTKSITVPSGHNKTLFVLAASYTDVDVSGVTFDGDAMTSVTAGGRTISGTIFKYHLFKLANPEAKTGDVVATWTDPTSDMFFHAFVCDGVDQTSATSGVIDNGGTSTTASVTLTSTKDYQLRVAAVISERAGNTPDSPQTVIESGDNNFGTDSTSYLGTSTAGSLVDTTFNIKDPERITTLFGFDIDALVGTKVEGRNLARVLRWDTASESWSAEDVVEENGVSAFIRDDNYVYVYTGEFGKLFFYNGEKLEPFTRIPGDWSPTQRAVIHQGAVATHLGVPVFGLSNLEGNPALQGVYSFGSYSKDYPKVLDLSFPISSGAFDGVTVGAVLSVGADLYVAWKDANGAGVDKLDYDNKYGSAYIETMMLSAPQERGILKTALEACAYYASLPASSGITFGYKKKYEADYATLTPVTDAKVCAVKARESIPEVANLQLKFGFTASGNDAPEVESFDYELAPLKK
jgi:hypothetical protein